MSQFDFGERKPPIIYRPHTFEVGGKYYFDREEAEKAFEEMKENLRFGDPPPALYDFGGTWWVGDRMFQDKKKAEVYLRYLRKKH